MRLTFIFKNDQWKVLKIFPSEIEEEITTQTFEVPLEILPKLEAIKTLEYQDNCENISFDIYYLNGKYTGIHNTRVSIRTWNLRIINIKK